MVASSLQAPSSQASPLQVGAGAGRRDRATARLRRFARDPMLAFLLAGGAIFGLYALTTGGDPVVYSADIHQALVAEQEALTGRASTPAERQRLMDDYVADELLFREAVATSVHLSDSVTRKRLVDRMRFLAVGNPDEPTEAEMVNHYAEHMEDYRAEPKFTFEQVYFAKQPADAAGTLAALVRNEAVTGDDFWVGRQFPRYGVSMIRGIFGQPFVDRLEAVPQGQWVGPIRSPRGWHYVRKSERVAPAIMPYAEIREQVQRDLMMARTRALLDARVGELKERYGVVDAR